MSATLLTASDLAALYHDHHRWLLGWLRQRVACRESAADLAQDTFVRILQKRQPERPQVPRAYLATIARGLMLNLRQRESLEREYLALLEHLPPDQQASPETALLAFEALLQIDILLRGLPDKVRNAFVMAQLEGCSYAEIAQRLGVSTSSIKQYLSRATAHCLHSELLDID